MDAYVPDHMLEPKEEKDWEDWINEEKEPEINYYVDRTAKLMQGMSNALSRHFKCYCSVQVYQATNCLNGEFYPITQYAIWIAKDQRHLEFITWTATRNKYFNLLEEPLVDGLLDNEED